jgi:hypothetical protein
MRLDELAPPKELKPGATGKVGNVTYKYDATRGWLLPNGRPAAGTAKNQLMLQYGRDPSGDPIQPGLLQRLGKKLGVGQGAPFGQGIDPKASALGKSMGVVGSMLGRAASKGIAAVSNKLAARSQDADGDGQPDAAPAQQAQQPQAPKPGVGDTRQGAVQVDQDLGNIVNQMRAYQPKQAAKPMAPDKVQDIMKDLANVRNNKDWAVQTGKRILKFANAGYDVSALHTKWSQEVAVGKKQKIMQDQFSEALGDLKKLAGI